VGESLNRAKWAGRARRARPTVHRTLCYAVAPVRRTGAVTLGRKWREFDRSSPRWDSEPWANRSTVPSGRAAPGGRGLLFAEPRPAAK